jgi:hypothetical protein
MLCIRTSLSFTHSHSLTRIVRVSVSQDNTGSQRTSGSLLDQMVSALHEQIADVRSLAERAAREVCPPGEGGLTDVDSKGWRRDSLSQSDLGDVSLRTAVRLLQSDAQLLREVKTDLEVLKSQTRTLALRDREPKESVPRDRSRSRDWREESTASATLVENVRVELKSLQDEVAAMKSPRDVRAAVDGFREELRALQAHVGNAVATMGANATEMKHLRQKEIPVSS